MSPARKPFVQPSEPGLAPHSAGPRVRTTARRRPTVDAVTAARQPVFVTDLDDDSPARQLRHGFDTAGRLLELVVLRFDSGNELVIHAMKVRPQYSDLLP